MTAVSIATSAQPIKRAWRQASTLVTSTRLAWLIIAFGATLRAAEYFSNRALYVDEGALALNVINRTFGEFFQTLDFNQAAPPGFLMLEKLAVLAFGDGELSLRLFPFVFSIAALVLFYKTARAALASWAVPIALLFFAVSEQVIYFSAQVKQYSSDCFITLLVVLAGLKIESIPLTARRAAVLAALGGLVVWVSHPSIFVLAGVGTTLGIAALTRREWPRFWTLIACFVVWITSFAILYLVSLRQLSANQQLETSWMRKGTFMPLPPTSLSDAKWFVTSFFRVFSNPGDLHLPWAAGLLFIAGCAALFVKRKTLVFLVIAPLLFTLIASGLHKYPFARRLLLFYVPLIPIAVVAGVEFVVKRRQRLAVPVGIIIVEVLLFQFAGGGSVSPSFTRLLFFISLSSIVILAAVVLDAKSKDKLYAATIGSAVLVLLLLEPVGGATKSALHPPASEDLRPLLGYVRDHSTPGDVLYVYHHYRASFQYYAPKYGFTPDEYLLGQDQRQHWNNGANEAYIRDLDELRGKARVWFVFSYVRSVKGVNEEQYLVQYLERIGRKQDQISSAGASAYLFDLSHQPLATADESGWQ